MGFRSTRKDADVDADRKSAQRLRHPSQARSTAQRSSSSGRLPVERVEEQFGLTIRDQETADRLQLLASDAPGRVQQWVDEGMPVDVMGDPQAIQAFRQRQEARPPEVPTNIERQNARSVQRSAEAAADASAAGSTQVPERVRDVLSSPGQSLDASIQRAMEERLGEEFGDVRIHTGANAAAACESIDARAFTVGNHVAFNAGEYDPSSSEGQHVLAHELAHVRQQTGGALSMLPQEGVELEVDPDPALEREAEETAQHVMRGEHEVQQFGSTDAHVSDSGSGVGLGGSPVVRRLAEDASTEPVGNEPHAGDSLEPLVRLLGDDTVTQLRREHGVARSFLADLARNVETFDRLRAQAKQSDRYPGDVEYVQRLSRGLASFTLRDELESDLDVRDVLQNHFTEDDVDQPFAYLLDTDKWKEGTRFDRGAHDWKHVVARHAVPVDRQEALAVPFGDDEELGAQYANDQTIVFPPSMTRSEIVAAIQIAVEHGRTPDEHDPAKIVYSGSKLERYGVSEMKVVRHPGTGQIITAHPLEGEDVVEWGTIKHRYGRGGGSGDS